MGRRATWSARAAAIVAGWVLAAVAGLAAPVTLPVVVGESTGTVRLTAGSAVVEQLGQIYVDGAGPWVRARRGDWRQSSETVWFTYCGVEDGAGSRSMPVAGWVPPQRSDDRIPGALMDIASERSAIDFMVYFTQGIGLDRLAGAPVRYDTIEPFNDGGEVGLRLEGSPAENSAIRLETIYRLAPASPRLRIESRLKNIGPDDFVPQLVDLADWGAGLIVVEGLGQIPAGRMASAATTDFLMLQGGDLSLAMVNEQGRMHGHFVSRPTQTRLLLAPSAPKPPAVLDDLTTLTAAPTPEPPPPPATRDQLYQRSLWMTRGNFDGALEAMLEGTDRPAGSVAGRVTFPENPELVAQTVVKIYGYRRGDPTSPQMLVSATPVDAEGNYEARVPDGWYFVRAELRGASDRQAAIMSLRVRPGEEQRRDFELTGLTGVRVRVVDEATSEPLAARIQIEGIPPTPQVDFGFPIAAEGYLNHTYIPPSGRMVRLNPGHWLLHAIHGIEYELGEAQVRLEPGQVKEVVIAVRQSNPTPGWLGVEVGMRTDATPGVAIAPADAALMVAAEGLDWVVTGDFERATDLAPELKQLGLEGRVRASRGFRTLLPAHPEWGHFLIYPIAADAPDPAVARAEWARLRTATEFIDTIRRLYPGALIQSDLPWRAEGVGYLAHDNVTLGEAAWELNPEIDPRIDVVNLLPARGGWEFRDMDTSWNTMLVGGYGWVLNSSSIGRTVFGAEPGYARTLIYMDTDDPAEVEEAALFAAYRAGRYQITNGPFIEMTIDGEVAGAVVPRDVTLPMTVRISAPSWADLRTVSIDKDGIMQQQLMLASIGEGGQRFPNPAAGPAMELTLADMKLRDFKDTFVTVTTIGTEPLNRHAPRYFTNQDVYPFAIYGPIVVDANGNGRFDRLEDYVWRGQ